MSNESPYLKPGRLPDIIAAIQALATYKYYKLEFSRWSERLSADGSRAEHWKAVFEQHPEFFRLDTKRERASLVWRRQLPKLFDVVSMKAISRDDYAKLDVSQHKDISRVPMEPKEITALIDVAVKLYGQALESKRETRWWITPVVAAGSVVLGAIIGGVLRS
jgi:hypothetical protein